MDYQRPWWGMFMEREETDLLVGPTEAHEDFRTIFPRELVSQHSRGKKGIRKLEDSMIRARWSSYHWCESSRSYTLNASWPEEQAWIIDSLIRPIQGAMVMVAHAAQRGDKTGLWFLSTQSIPVLWSVSKYMNESGSHKVRTLSQSVSV